MNHLLILQSSLFKRMKLTLLLQEVRFKIENIPWLEQMSAIKEMTMMKIVMVTIECRKENMMTIKTPFNSQFLSQVSISSKLTKQAVFTNNKRFNS